MCAEICVCVFSLCMCVCVSGTSSVRCDLFITAGLGREGGGISMLATVIPIHSANLISPTVPTPFFHRSQPTAESLAAGPRGARASQNKEKCFSMSLS